MTRGEASQVKVHYKGKDEDFIVLVDDEATYKKWLADKSVPLAHFVSAFKIFVTHKQGTQGMMDTASKATLDNQFGTSVDEEVIKQILEKGHMQNSEMSDRQGPKNDSMSSMNAH
ncbi:shwachman-Bodian-Diamond syndrome (SBDS) protein [Hirsutella rhossiliensis]|uniref:Shwachman-Bodian-Diamond syndrome (SBDS) protein n=1 Tax=Hirsutella rhossiliensis TaxID=111463 RepID=A0A9P8MQF5_9HYPO|nr:shwachman-Bodian-Diamond syndrome (SBDS) protein [Hirsutella rhossiliensis]KAH0957342.1 shwachman-Bodian-Diamond syndrome (SBDS) protein [Hirsutella rhossiliensis]